MHIDWSVAATIAAPIIALFVGVWVNRHFESRPVLVSYFGHIAVFTHRAPGQQQQWIIHTHAVVLRNAGRRPATNVRLHHLNLPDFRIFPQVVHQVDTLADGTQDIVIPTLVPGEEITISYLYFPPMTFAQVNAGIKSDQGFAQQIPVLLQRQLPKWFNYTVLVLTLAGLISILYLIWLGVARLLLH